MPAADLRDRPVPLEQVQAATPGGGGPVGTVVMYSSVSVDGFVADEDDRPGPLR